VKTIDGAHIDAVGVLAFDAALGDDVSHRAVLSTPASALSKRKNYKAIVP